MVLLVMSMLGILVFATYRFRRDIYENMRSFSVLLGLIVVVMSAAGVVAATESSPALVPVALAGLLAAALFDSLLGLIVVSTITGILMGQPHFAGLAAPMVTVAGGVTAAFAVTGIRTRSQSWVLIALIAVAYLGAGILLNFTGHYSLNDLWTTAAFGALNATLCTGLGIGVGLPLLEVFTGRTTEQSLPRAVRHEPAAPQAGSRARLPVPIPIRSTSPTSSRRRARRSARTRSWAGSGSTTTTSGSWSGRSTSSRTSRGD